MTYAMTTAEKLLPCPFCGGPACNVADEYITCGAGWNSECPGHRVQVDRKAWNTRTLASQLEVGEDAAEIASLKARVAELGDWYNAAERQIEFHRKRAEALKAENERLLNIIGVARCPSDGRHFVAECIQSTCGCSIGLVLNAIKETALTKSSPEMTGRRGMEK